MAHKERKKKQNCRSNQQKEKKELLCLYRYLTTITVIIHKPVYKKDVHEIMHFLQIYIRYCQTQCLTHGLAKNDLLGKTEAAKNPRHSYLWKLSFVYFQQVLFRFYLFLSLIISLPIALENKLVSSTRKFVFTFVPIVISVLLYLPFPFTRHKHFACHSSVAHT